MSSVKELLQTARMETDRVLEDFVPQGTVEPATLHSAIRWSLFAGGKRFRPALVLAVGRAFGAPDDKLFKTAAAIEMIHTYSLIHDDLPAMDDDDLRRGRETCHVKFGEATAILAGDVLQAMAFELIADDERLDHSTRVRLISEIAHAAGTPTGMAAGQQMDLEAEGVDVSLEALERIHASKTGAMIRAAARAGAVIAGAEDSEIEAVSDYAERLGLLFQITDDLLDISQPSEVLGKTAGKDVKAQKATYPSICGEDGARNLAREVHRQAIEHLGRISRQTPLLEEIANLILYRTT